MSLAANSSSGFDRRLLIASASTVLALAVALIFLFRPTPYWMVLFFVLGLGLAALGMALFTWLLVGSPRGAAAGETLRFERGADLGHLAGAARSSEGLLVVRSGEVGLELRSEDGHTHPIAILSKGDFVPASLLQSGPDGRIVACARSRVELARLPSAMVDGLAKADA